MVIAFIADVHGNLPALQAVLAEIDDLGCERIISLGDIGGYYPFINECCDLIRQRGIVNLYGNHDHYLVSTEGCPRSRSANVCIEYQRRTITSENLAWLSQSLKRLDFDNCSLVHGGWIDPLDEYMTRLIPAYFVDLPARIFISGHTHVQGVWPLGDKVYCNPGSVGQPRDGNWQAAFATLSDQTIELHRTPYDVEITIAKMRELGFPNAFAENLRGGVRIGGAVSRVVVEQRRSTT